MRRLLGTVLVSLGVHPAVHAEIDVAPARALAAEIEQGQHRGVESFVMLAGAEIIARYVAPGLATQPPDLRSATKSITAILIGIAIDRGEVPSVQARLVDLLPARRALLAGDARKAAITLEHLLTMRSGLACDDWDEDSPGHEDRMYRKRDWLEFWARQPMRGEPGTWFSYCTGNVIALGEVLANATGLLADEYAARHLFGPLGIERAHWQRWNRQRAIDTGGHLRLAPDDLLKIGRLVLQQGASEGRQLVSAHWLAAMTQAHVSIPGRTEQYGYLWWISQTRNPALPATQLWWAQGNGGNFLIVLPQLHAALVVTGTRFNRPDALQPMFWLRDRLLPAMK